MVFMVFFVFCRGHKAKVKISKNIDFPWGKLIFLRVGAMKNLSKIDKNLMLEALMRKKSVSGAKNCVLEAKNFEFGTPEPLLKAKKPKKKIVWLCWEVFEVAQRNAQGP